MKVFKLEIVSPESNIIFDKVVSILVNGLDGKIMILANHAPYIIYMLPGIIVIKIDSNQEQKITTSSGILEIANNYCNIIINNFLI